MHTKSILIGFASCLILTGLISGSYFLGLKQFNKQSKIVVVASITPTMTLTPTPSATPSPSSKPKSHMSTSTPAVTQIPTSTQLANLSTLCQTDVDSFKAKAQLKYNEMVNGIISQPEGQGFISSQQGIYAKAQYFAQIDNGGALMMSWCLEHNRDYSGMPIPKY